MTIFRKLFFLGIFISFALGQFARLQLGQGIAFTLLDITVLFFLVINLVHLFLSKKKEEVVHNKLGRPVLFFTLVCIFSLFVNFPALGLHDGVVAGLYLVRFILYISIVFFVPLFSKKEKKLFISSLLAGMLVAIMLGYIQFIFYPNLGNLFYLGWDDHLYRLFSVFLDPNFASVLFALLSLLILGSLIGPRKDGLAKRFVTGVIFFLVTFAIFLTYSRTGMITLIIGVTILLWIREYRRFLAFCIIFFLVLLVLTSNVKVEGLNPFRTKSTSARVESMRIALAIFSKSPIVGVGFNAYRYAQHRYGFRQNGAWETSHADAGTDTSLLFVLATTGIIGFLSYSYIWYVLLKTTRAVMRKSRDVFSAVVFSSLIAILASSLFLNTLFYPFVLVFILGMYGVMERNSP